MKKLLFLMIIGCLTTLIHSKEYKVKCYCKERPKRAISFKSLKSYDDACGTCEDFCAGREGVSKCEHVTKSFWQRLIE